MSLPTLRNSVQTLQRALQARAKAEPCYCFYSPWDKDCRVEGLVKASLYHAYAGCARVGRVSYG